MTKKTEVTLDYRDILLLKVKENFISFLFGLGVISFLLISATLLFLTKLSPRPMAKKEQKPSVISASKKIRTYTIQEGDQLWLVAQNIYGSGFNMEDIMRANNISNPDLIEVGQKIIIPDVKSRFPTTGEISSGIATSNKPTSNKKAGTYTVKEGDSLAAIALQMYGDSYAWTKIAEANKLINPNLLTAGMVLQIPR